jgi:hypothetical protein
MSENKYPPLASKQLEPLLTPLSDIRPHPENYKQHPPEQIKALRASVKAFGVTAPIKVNLEGEIVAGHGMYQLYIEDGYTHAPVIYEALDKKLSKAYIVADNETARKAVTDQDQLSNLLQEISEIPDFDIESTGFNLEELDSILDIPEESSFSNGYQNNSSYNNQNPNSYLNQKYNTIPEDSPEYDESIANEVKACVCPKCGFKFPDKV